MHQNESGEYVLSRREYTQLAAAVPASHATGDDGWLSGLFGGSDNDGPGLLEDVQYRHEDSHIITDPKIIDYVGAAVDIERPNEYDEAVRIRISGDLVVDGADIDPASIGKETPTEEIHTKSHSSEDLNIGPDIYQTVNGAQGGTAADIQAAIDSLSTGRTHEEGIRVVGQVECNQQITIPSYTFLDLRHAELTLTSGIASNSALLRTETDAQMVTIFGGKLDGNKAAFAGNGNDAIYLLGSGGSTGDFGDNRNRVLHTSIRDFEREGIKVDARRALLLGVTIATTDSTGLHLRTTDIDCYNVGVWNPGGNGIQLDSSYCELRHCWAAKADIGIRVRDSAKYNNVVGGYSENCGRWGILVEAGTDVTRNQFEGMEILGNGQSSTNPGVEISAPRTVVKNCRIADTKSTTTQGNSVRVNSGVEDTKLSEIDDAENPTGISDAGTRTRYDEVIGAGPLGGVDLSVTSGQREGERAMSSGATANTGDTAYSYWTWDATNAVWVDESGNTV